MILVWLSFSEGWRQVPQSHLERLPKGQALELPKGLRKNKSYQNNNETIENILYMHASVTGLEVLKIAERKGRRSRGKGKTQKGVKKTEPQKM